MYAQQVFLYQLYQQHKKGDFLATQIKYNPKTSVLENPLK